MPPHGGGMTGVTHSHDPEFPDDEWNLYSMLDAEGMVSFNVTRPDRTIGIFKPFVRRLLPEPDLISDADHEIIIVARFTSPVHIRKIMVIGGGDPAHHPAEMRCYVNQDNIDFTNVDAFHPAQTFRLPVNAEGTVELVTALRPFTNITTLAFYFPANHGDVATTALQYIGLQGEHTHYRREAVDAVYEVLCNGQDIVQPEEQAGAHTPHMH